MATPKRAPQGAGRTVNHPSRKLTLTKETMKDLTPSRKSRDAVKGGVKTVACTPTLSPS